MLPQKDDIKAFYDESPDRALAIALPAIIENRITSILQAALRNDSKVRNDLFQPSGALGSFGAKIRMAYMIYVIPEDLFSDLRTLIKIRNAFAHQLEIKSLDQPPVDSWIKSMSVYSGLKKLGATPINPTEMSDHLQMGLNLIAVSMRTPRGAFRECVRMMIHSLYELEVKVRASMANIHGTGG